MGVLVSAIMDAASAAAGPSSPKGKMRASLRLASFLDP